MTHQAEEIACVKARMCSAEDAWEMGCRSRGGGRGLVSTVFECQASGTRAATWSATNLPAMSGPIGGNSLEQSEYRAEAGAVGGPAWQGTDARLRWTVGGAQEAAWEQEVARSWV